MGDPAQQIDADALSDLPRALEAGSDRQIARELLFAARLDGFETVGQLHDHIERMSCPERRQLLDRARERVGLATTEQVDQRRRFEVTNRNARLTAGQESEWQICAADSCTAIPLDPTTGIPTTTKAKRWFCRAHRDQAQPGDLQPRPLRIRRAPSGALVEVDEAELAREATAEESRRRQREAEVAERQTEAAELDAHERAKRDQLDRELPPGFPR
jgi:hypothetical protein